MRILRPIGVIATGAVLALMALFLLESLWVTGWYDVRGTKVYVYQRPFGKAQVYMYVSGRVDGDHFRALSELMTTKALTVKSVTIDIHSGGGALFEGVRAVEEMNMWKAKGIEVITVTRSLAASAAAFIFLHGDKRLMSKNAWLMHHSVQVGMYAPSLSEKIALTALQKQLNQAWLDRVCLNREAARVMFDIPFGSDRQVWIDGPWAYRLCLAEATE